MIATPVEGVSRVCVTPCSWGNTGEKRRSWEVDKKNIWFVKFCLFSESMSLHHHHPPPHTLVLFCREEISTLSRQASFRRMNSVSTDPRGAVLRLNYSLHIKHTAASLSYIFLPRPPDPDSACQAFVTSLIKIRTLAVPHVSRIFKHS